MGQHIHPGATLLVQENRRWSTDEDFRAMAIAHGLEWQGTLGSLAPYYYIVARNPG